MRAGGTNSYQVRGIAVDSSGNSYVSGVFTETIFFGSTTLTSSGSYDIFVAQINGDTDSDGIPDMFDDCWNGANGWTSSLLTDFDTDGCQDSNEDTDDDNDGFADVVDSFPLDASEWVDTDADGIGNNADSDDDGDSVPDVSDAFPLDASEWDDNDGDGVGDNADLDDDNDGWSDSDETECQTDPYSSFSVPEDFDGDHICDRVDTDDDGDGTNDSYDIFPFDATEWEDLDFDGIGNNADTDDDGDSWSDLEEPNCGTDPLNANSYPDDFDADRICDALDPDDDNDMVLDINDALPFNPSEFRDTDGDGIGNNADTDDDNDSVLDVNDDCSTGELFWISQKTTDHDLDGCANHVDDDAIKILGKYMEKNIVYGSGGLVILLLGLVLLRKNDWK